MKLLLIFLLTLSFNGFAQDITPGCQGEGFYNIKIKDKEFNFSYEQIEFQVQTPAKTETWYEIKVGKLKGYTNVFPFQGCLE